jgi:hypothetical protein
MKREMAGIEVRAAVVSFTALLGVGCGGGNPASTSSTARSAAAKCAAVPTREAAYILNGDVVSMYTVDSCTGALTEMVPSSVATGTTQQETAPEAMAIDAAGRFAYVANLVSNAADDATISMYTIDPGTGALTPRGLPRWRTC